MPPKRKINNNGNQGVPPAKKLKKTTVQLIPLFSYGEKSDLQDPIQVPVGSELILGRGPPLHLPNKKISRQQLRIQAQSDENQKVTVKLTRV